MVWIALAIMTAAAVLCVVWPLTKPRLAALASNTSDLEFYKSQLAALDRDVATGLVAPAEAAGSRAEIGRRLIAAADGASPPPASGGRRVRLLAASAVVIAFVPLVSLGLYLKVGAPNQADEPLASRPSVAGPNELANAIAKIEAHLVSHPEDGKGFDLLAPIYLRLGRAAEAAQAFQRALALQGESASRRSGYAQALMMQADGVVTADAKAAFEQALADDPTAPQPQYFLGLAALEDGDKDKARTLWTKLIASAPDGAAWVPMVKAKLGTLDGNPESPAASVPQGLPAPQGPAAAAIAALPADQQAQAIHGMVDGLAARLAQNGQDKDGWLRLVRAYAVLGEKTKALTALADARKNLSSDTQAEAQLDGLARELGLGS